jgi:Zn-dependent protease/CBS domain-containing protein
MNLGGSFTLGRIRGIELRVHWSWLLIGGFLAWSLVTDVFRPANPSWTPAQTWAAALAVSALFFASIMIHELAHSFVAQARGMQVPSITLFVFGGVSGMSDEMRSAGDEFRIAIVGPLTSWVIALLFGALAYFLSGSGIAAAFSYLALTNLALGAFNLLPGFPLDGGRVFRAIVWQQTGSLLRATHAAARAGNVIAIGLISLGAVYTLAFGIGAGLWYVLIGLFLNNAASSSLSEMRLEQALRLVLVRDVMRHSPAMVAPAATLQELVVGRILANGERAFLVGTNPDSPIVGIITATDLSRVPRDRWASTSVERTMTPAERAITVDPQAPVLEALRRLTEHDIHELPVVEGDRVVGLLTAIDVLQQVQLRAQFSLQR